MNKPQKVNSIVSNKNRVSSRVVKIDLEHVEPREFNFDAGQFISLHVGNGEYRSYSICSDSTNKRKISLICAVAHEGLGANYIKSLKQGDLVDFIGPSGDFSLRKTMGDIYFLATGTGIAPYISMLWQLKWQNSSNKVVLLHGVRHKDEALFLNTLDMFSNELPNFSYQIFLSQDTPGSKYFNGRITSVLDKLDVNNENQYYLCGLPAMITEVKEFLQKSGVNNANIFTEKFLTSK